MRMVMTLATVLIAINLSLIVYVMSGHFRMPCDAHLSDGSLALLGTRFRDKEAKEDRQTLDLVQRVKEIDLEALELAQHGELDGPGGINNTIPGRAIPDECNAEAHADYGGFAIAWGLTHPKDSAADCCQACLDHARDARPGDRKCNIWVYCPAEEGCYSPDIYEHKQFECWLKQADEPRHNFKGEYSMEYRRHHPTSPLVVPWASGVISSS